MTEVRNDMRVAQEEIFGPVLAVIRFAYEEEMIRQANDTVYSLSAGVWTKDLARAHRVAKRLKAGTVWINSYNLQKSRQNAPGFNRGMNGCLVFLSGCAII